MVLKQAMPEDAKKLETFYRNAIADPNGMAARYCRWIYGKHPSDTMIEGYIAQKALYFLEDEQGIAAAAALTPSQDESYHVDGWKMDLRDDEVSVLHILCVDPLRVRKGLGRSMVKAMIDTARQNGKKALRLDALYTNTPAQRLYVSLGFVQCAEARLYTANLGWTDFFLYEMPL